MTLRNLRTGLWHLREGGISQFREYRKRRRSETHTPRTGFRRTSRGGIKVEPWPIPKSSPRRSLRVGVILDEFSAVALGFEWAQVALDRDNWHAQVEDHPIDLLFVESAWRGNSNSWQNSLTGPLAPVPELRFLIDWCKKHQIPTVFWNKEDPVHFDDFLDTARLFDHVFTTDSNQLDRYKQILNHDRVGVMTFAAQERLHNPTRPDAGFHDRDVAFAGTYFAHTHSERQAQTELLLHAALDVSPRMPAGLEIYSRYLDGDQRYQFPSKYKTRVVGSLAYEEMLTAYRMHKVFLNVNTVTDSPTMCSRRVFEILASGTPVVTTPNRAINDIFDSTMINQVETHDQVVDALRALTNSERLRSAQTHRAQREIWRRHTYNHRINDLLKQIGLVNHLVPTRASVSMLASTNRPTQLGHIIRTAASQRGVDKELVLLTHGFNPNQQELRGLAKELGLETLVLLYEDESTPLGECLNRLGDTASGKYVAKIDDDDFYGPYYLADQAMAVRYSDADIVGKECHYIQLAGQNLTTLYSPHREHRFTTFVPGPTLFMDRDTVRSVRFPALRRGEDTGFLRRVTDAGGTIYSADRNQFVRYRSADHSAHTWPVPEWHVLANSQVAYYGDDITPAMI